MKKLKTNNKRFYVVLNQNSLPKFIITDKCIWQWNLKLGLICNPRMHFRKESTIIVCIYFVSSKELSNLSLLVICNKMQERISGKRQIWSLRVRNRIWIQNMSEKDTKSYFMHYLTHNDTNVNPTLIFLLRLFMWQGRKTDISNFLLLVYDRRFMIDEMFNERNK